ncbi:dynamin family protein [Amycolatopsis sp. NPDC021455]|uniref:dynamin family protein n=1 Tax=Amycolatopsis sp. NPDC021455 TaxID=3154901 RepID=UPI0033CB3752
MTSAADTADLLTLLDAAVGETRSAGREDLAEKLVACKHRLTSGAWHVLVAGEFKKGKSTLVNALLGVEVCGTDPVVFSAVPTLVRHGERAGATLVPDDESAGPRPVDVRAAAEHGRTGLTGDGTRLRAVEVALPRQLLAEGLVLADTPGLGGGFAAAAAAATMRALALADGVIMVTDASQELTATEVEFLRHAVEACPTLLVALTKIDFYPHWRRILDLDREHLRAAGIDAEIVAVSAPLRELAVTTGDPALNAESGYPVLADRLRAWRAAERSAKSAPAAAALVRTALRQVAGSLAAEHSTLTRPEQRPDTERRAERARGLASPSSRWLNTITDRFADIQVRMESELATRTRQLEAELTRGIRESDPTREWAGIVPRIYRRTNEELTDAHASLLRSIDELAEEIGALFDASADEVGALGDRTVAPSSDVQVGQLGARAGSKLEVGMHAARGWSLSSSVVTTLLVTTLHPGLLIALPVTAVLGSIFAVKAVRSYRNTRLDAARNEAVRTVVNYLNQARADAHRASLDLIRHSRSRIRDYYLDQAAELVSAVKHEQAAVARAASTADGDAAARGAAAKAELDRVNALLVTADRFTGGAR